MTAAPEQYDLDHCNVLRETNAAVLIETEEHGELWVPISQVSRIVRRSTAFTSQVRMTAWIAKKKGLI